jgi:hypothetical protein
LRVHLSLTLEQPVLVGRNIVGEIYDDIPNPIRIGIRL